MSRSRFSDSKMLIYLQEPVRQIWRIHSTTRQGRQKLLNKFHELKTDGDELVLVVVGTGCAGFGNVAENVSAVEEGVQGTVMALPIFTVVEMVEFKQLEDS